MPDSDYTTTPPAASAIALSAISEKISDIKQDLNKLSELPGKIDRMNMQLEQLSRDHQQTRTDLQQTRSSFQKELESVHADVSELKTSKTRIDTLSDWFKWGGLAVIALVVSAWVTLATKIDTTAVQSANNTQRIEVVEKTQDQRGTTIESIQEQIRDLIISAYKRGEQP